MGAEVTQHSTALMQLIDSAHAALASGYSTEDFEPDFARVLDFILNDGHHEEHCSLIIELMRRRCISWELLSYLMHELRWDEVRQEALATLAHEDDWRVKTPLSHVLSAFEDDWSDKSLYSRWSISND